MLEAGIPKNPIYGQAALLTGLVAYQEGAVISRELIKHEIGTVTVFAFDAGQGLSEHTAPFDAMVQVLDGEAVVTIGGTEHTVRCGEIIIMPAKIPHSLQARVRYKMLLTMIRQRV